MQAPIGEALAARGTLAMRAQYLAENSPYGQAAVSAWVDNLIADGPTLRHPDKRIVAAWNRWWNEADAEGLGDLGLMLRRAVRSLVIAGEAFAPFESDPDDDGLRLRLIAPEQVDASKSVPAEAVQARIVAGVELDARGQRRAYWIFSQALDDPLGGAGQLQSERVDASDVLHIFDPHAPGAVRGRSWLGAAATRALEVDRPPNYRSSSIPRWRRAGARRAILAGAFGAQRCDGGFYRHGNNLGQQCKELTVDIVTHVRLRGGYAKQ
jgi:hypothetical protein